MTLFSTKEIREQLHKRGNGVIAETPGKWKLMRYTKATGVRYFRQDKGSNPVEVDPSYAYDLYQDATKQYMTPEKAFPHIVEGRTMEKLADRLRKVANKIEAAEVTARVAFDLSDKADQLYTNVSSVMVEGIQKMLRDGQKSLTKAGFRVTDTDYDQSNALDGYQLTWTLAPQDLSSPDLIMEVRKTVFGKDVFIEDKGRNPQIVYESDAYRR